MFGTAVYGNEALWHGTAKVILAGAGLELVLAGVAGILCSLIFSAYRVEGFTAIFAGLAFAVLWYLLWYLLLFPRIAPLVPMYISRSAAIAAHLLLGLLLSRAPAYFRQIHPEPPPVPFAPLSIVERGGNPESLNQPSSCLKTTQN